ncbi:MAG: 50S ribosomal protein L24 [Candidatus Saccharimonadia bacterium]
MKLKRKDTVMMMAGRDKGKTGEITRVIPTTNSIIVEGLGIVKRHTKPSNKNPRGGILEVARPISSAKVALVCPNCKKPTRIGYTIKNDNKERICRKCQVVVK